MKKIFTLFAAMLFAASTWAADLPAGNYVYFEKPNDWSAVSLLLGHNTYSIGYNMTNIANTNLYYWKTDSWGGYTEYAFIDAKNWGGESGNSAKPGTRKEWATHKTAAFTTTIAKYHLFTSAGSKSSHASSFETAVNRTQTIQIQVKDGENWTNAPVAPATVTATTYALTSASATTKQTASITVAGVTTSATLSAAYSATVTLEYIDLAEGYMFVGWFNANGEQISNYNVTDATTVYARFEESAEKTNNVTVSYVCNGVSLQENTHLTVGTTTASRVEAPAIDNYIFQSWTLSTGVESVDATANPIYITTKVGETDYTLTANYIEVPKVTIYAINSSKWEAIAVHHWVEDGSGTAWPGDLMTKTELKDKNGFDVYSATFVAEHVSCIFNNNDKGNQTATLTVENGKYYDIKGQKWYASLDEVPLADPLATNIYLAGGMNEWNATTTMFKKATADATSASVTLALEAQTYEFKIVVDGQWYGNNGTMTREYCEGWIFRVKQDDGQTDESNAKITTDIAGEYTFTWNMADNKLTVTYPALPTPKYTVTLTNNIGQDSVYVEGIGMLAVTEGAGEYEAGEEVAIRAQNLPDYYFIGWADENGDIITNDMRHVITVTEDVTYTAMYATLLSVTSTDLDLSTPGHLKGTDPTFQMGTLTIDLVLGELDEEEGVYAIVPEESTLAVGEVKFQIEEGIAAVVAEEGLAMARVFVTFEEQLYVFDIKMSAAVTAETIDVTIENATVNITEYETGFGGGKATELEVSADWVYEADGLTYAVAVVVPEFDPTATSGEYTAIFFVKGEGDAFGMTEEAKVTVAIEGGKVIVTGEGIQAYNGNVYNLTISGALPTATGLDNVNTTVVPVKMIENGQLIVIKDGVKFNAQGAQL